MEQNNEQPNYYAVIPAVVRYDKKLPLGARMLYGEISALSNKEGYCWASDSYFKELYDVSRKTINTWVKSLEKRGYIKINTSRDSRGTLRELHLVVLQGCNKNVTPVSQKGYRGVSQKGYTNNTYINNTYNNSTNVLVETPSSKAVREVYDHFIQAFNKNPNLYRLTDKRKRKLQARLKDAGKDLLLKAIDNTAGSSFHNGDNDRGWCADLDFIIRSYEQVERLASIGGASKEIDLKDFI